ncbi:hypothetical protein NDU88_000872 [Pleurodeles waltl]|uniref:Uncharacterized protein n=1 Tax=Pleurodeles waltl TaxID=8319 RepID=A0AAV7Q8H5_PLEWA|nr:hypothetical protein NDU88_000872 [Pleurodeles waltl]
MSGGVLALLFSEGETDRLLKKVADCEESPEEKAIRAFSSVVQEESSTSAGEDNFSVPGSEPLQEQFLGSSSRTPSCCYSTGDLRSSSHMLDVDTFMFFARFVIVEVSKVPTIYDEVLVVPRLDEADFLPVLGCIHND